MLAANAHITVMPGVPSREPAWVPPPDEADPVPNGARRAPRTGKVLIADDSPSDRAMLRRLLAESGFRAEVEEADTAARALELLRQREYDCALIDYWMPDSDGISVIRTLRENDAVRTPLILVTNGGGGELTGLQGVREGAQDFLVKHGLEPSRLARALRYAVARHKAWTRLAESRDELRQTNQALELEVLHDRLTQVLSRRGLERALAQVRGRPGTVAPAPAVAALMDCDGFKRINDEHGYVAGDAVLVELARRIRAAVRPSDVVARIGGDEFLIVFTDTPFPAAISIAERIRQEVSHEPVRTGGASYTVTASIGLAPLPEGDLSIAEVLRRTEQALRRSKESGKNRMSIAEAPNGPGRAAPESVQEMLRALGEPGRVQTLLQPLRKLSDGCVIGVEATSRIARGPDHFPAELFRSNHARDCQRAADLACLRAALRAAAEVKPVGVLHLNLLPATLAHLGSRGIAEELGRVELRGGVCLELPEELCGEVLGDLVDIVPHLRYSGIRVALDDFRDGKAGLEALVLLKPDCVKLPVRLIAGIESSDELQGTVRRLVEVACALGADVAAVGIESEGAVDLLRSLGVVCGQGFLWGRPVVAAPAPAAQARRAGSPGGGT